MSEVVVAFGGTERIEGLTDGVPEGVDGTGGRGAQLGFELGKTCSIGFRSGL